MRMTFGGKVGVQSSVRERKEMLSRGGGGRGEEASGAEKGTTAVMGLSCSLPGPAACIPEAKEVPLTPGGFPS